MSSQNSPASKYRGSIKSSYGKVVTSSNSCEQSRLPLPTVNKQEFSTQNMIREEPGAASVSREEHSEIASWVEIFPTTKSKKNLSRDFSDGVLLAELIHYYFPKFVELHNYVPASSAKSKKNNWVHLNRKVFPKLGMTLCETIIDNVIQAKAGAVEKVLLEVKKRIDAMQTEKEAAAARAAMIGQGGDGCKDDELIDVVCQAHMGNIPKFLIHSGYKYVQEIVLDDKIKALTDTSGKVKELESKNRRLETLVGLKEQRLEDLTLQLHRMKIEYETKCSQDGNGAKPNRLPWNGFI